MDGAPYEPVKGEQEGCSKAEGVHALTRNMLTPKHPPATGDLCAPAATALSQVGKAKVIWKQIGEHLNAIETNLNAGAVPTFNAELADKGADRLHTATIALAAQVRRMGREPSTKS